MYQNISAVLQNVGYDGWSCLRMLLNIFPVVETVYQWSVPGSLVIFIFWLDVVMDNKLVVAGGCAPITYQLCGLNIFNM